MRTVTDYTFAVIPMFLLMGAFVTNSGMSRELFRAANAFLGHLRGGLGIATIAACGGFAAISRLLGRDRRDVLDASPIRRCAASAIRNPSPPA